MKSEKWYRIL